MTQLIDIKVPNLGESVSQATVVNWLKKEDDSVHEDETILELETEKVTIEVNAPQSGILKSLKAKVGTSVQVGDLLATLAAGGPTAVKKASPKIIGEGKTKDTVQPLPLQEKERPEIFQKKMSPAVRKQVAEYNIDPTSVEGRGKEGRLLKKDILDLLAHGNKPISMTTDNNSSFAENEERVPMSRLRQTIAKRLKEAQNTGALLTTFNEIDMTELMHLRKLYKEDFEKKHNIKLGFMSFFVKACILALKEFPAVNAQIDQTDIIYKNHYDIGVAVSTPHGLVVPVVRDADALNFAEIEKTIVNLAEKGRDGKLAMTEMMGGTFTITNGGVFGSLMSTPIINAPQSAILGMHKIQDRPMAIDDKVVIRSMMYVALTYDHRIIDGREAVSFLVRIKECIENPERILLAI